MFLFRPWYPRVVPTWVVGMKTFAVGIPREQSLSVAPASLGKHLAIGLEYATDVHFLEK